MVALTVAYWAVRKVLLMAVESAAATVVTMAVGLVR